jgi:tetratricopeptide (TPR) repeat protein
MERVGTIGAVYAGVLHTGVGASAVVTTVHAPTPDTDADVGVDEVFVGRVTQTQRLLAALTPHPTPHDPGKPDETGEPGESGAGRAGAMVVCAVQGMGGIGKTALARHTATLAVEQGWFPGGAIVVDLHGYDPDPAMRVQPGQVYAPALRALGVPVDAIPASAVEQPTAYHQWLDTQATAGRRVLVVLDNAADLTQVQDLLPTPWAARVHRVVITSRDTLPVPGAGRLELGVLTDSEARDLLRATLDRHAPSRGLAADPRPDTDAGAGAVGEVVGWCGRLPLAVVIAAGVLAEDPDLTITELAAELADTQTRLEALNDGTGGVHAAFLTSWQRLRARDPEAARVLCLLTAAPGPDVDVDAAAAAVGVEAAVVRVRVRVLTRAHLLQSAGRRWGFHDLIRLDVTRHAIPDLEVQQRELGAATDRLLGHYLTVTGIADGWVRSVWGYTPPVGGRFARREQALAWLDTERANLVAAVVVAAADSGRDQVAVTLAARLAEFLLWRRQLDDGVTVAQVAARAAERMQDLPRYAGALTNVGNTLRQVRRFDEAITALTTAREIYRETGNRHGEASAWNSLGLALGEVRRFDEAITAHTTATTIYRETGNRHGEASAWNNLGLALREVRRFDEAITATTTAREIYRETGNRYGEASAWGNLSNALAQVRRFDEAITALTTATIIFRETGDRHGEASAWNSRGLALQQVRRFEEAITATTTAGDLYRETGDRHGEAGAWGNLGAALQQVRRFDEAITAHTTATTIFRETGDRHGEGMEWGNLGNTLRQVRRFEEAITATTTAGDLYRETGDRHGEAGAWNNLGLALREVRRFDEAITAHTTAREIYRETGDRHGEASAWNNLGRRCSRYGGSTRRCRRGNRR